MTNNNKVKYYIRKKSFTNWNAYNCGYSSVNSKSEPLKYNNEI